MKFGDLLLVHVGLPVHSALIAELSDKMIRKRMSVNVHTEEVESKWRHVYLQGRDALADWLRVLSQDALLVQELPVPAVAGRLEEAVVEDIFQGLVERAQDPLLGHPDRGVRVEPHAFLVESKKLIKP